MKETKKDAPLANTAHGRLEGTVIKTRGKVGIAAFLGVPFAKPPVGDLRWRDPEPPDRWSGTRPANSFGPACAQNLEGQAPYLTRVAKAFDAPLSQPRRIDYSEDCLYLNIFTDSTDRRAKRPVMVWIHGGSFRYGTGADYDPGNLVREGVVVVTINYRLGVFGFLAHPQLSAESPHDTSGNYGLLDQIEALRWVKRNIASFGGDPDKVTIFGESAGAQSVCHLMISPPARGLFHRAIAQSGVGLHVHTQGRSAEETGAAFATSVGADDLKRLRDADAGSLIESAEKFPGVTNPIIDGYVLVDHPARSFSTGHFHRVPFLLGSNADEGTGLNVIGTGFKGRTTGELICTVNDQAV